MSRRHHGNRPHRSSGQPRLTDTVRSRLDVPAAATNPTERVERSDEDRQGPSHRLPNQRPSGARAPAIDAAAEPNGPVEPGRQPAPRPEAVVAAAVAWTPREESRPPVGPPPEPDGRGPRPESSPVGAMASCTAPQLRRFIKSRPYVPMHELRRRFGINGTEDDVSSIDLGVQRVYVGLPPREGSLLGELLRGGDIGFELSLDPRTPIVIGLYPMRPVARS